MFNDLIQESYINLTKLNDHFHFTFGSSFNLLQGNPTNKKINYYDILLDLWDKYIDI